MTAAATVPGQQRAAAIAAQVHRVDAVQISPGLATLIHHWLGRYAELAAVRYGSAPEGLQDTQYALAEALASGADFSRWREQNTASVRGLLALSNEAVVDIRTAAEMLDRQEDSVRDMCRHGRLDAIKQSGRWFPKLAAVQERLARREDDR